LHDPGCTQVWASAMPAVVEGSESKAWQVWQVQQSAVQVVLFRLKLVSRAPQLTLAIAQHHV